MNKHERKAVETLLVKLKAAIRLHDKLTSDYDQIRLALLELVTAPRKKP